MVKFNTYYFQLHGQSRNRSIFKRKNRKAGFLVLDITWKVFSQTGNIETYLLYKELENVDNEENDADEDESNEVETTKM